MARVVDNNGIGALYATFNITKTGEDVDLTIDNVGDAVAAAGSNQVNLGNNGGKLLGRLEHVSGDLATVQVAGVIRLKNASGETPPFIGNAVVIKGDGGVYRAPSIDPANGDPAGGNVARGTAIAVDGTNGTCDILL